MNEKKLEQHLKTKPYYSFDTYKRLVSPSTRHTEQTYAAFQFHPNQIPRDSRHVGAVFVVTGEIRREIPAFERGEKLRVTAVNSNWVWAVPDTYVEKFWE